MLSFVTLPIIALSLLATTSADTFTVKAFLPGNTFDGKAINAAGEAFYIGGSPATYCPTEVIPNCPNVTGTVFAAGFTQLDVVNSNSFCLVFSCCELILFPGRGSWWSASLRRTEWSVRIH